MSKNLYIGLEELVPIYGQGGTTETIEFSYGNLDKFFSIITSSGNVYQAWTYSQYSSSSSKYVQLVPNNLGTAYNSTISHIRFKAKCAATMYINYSVYTEANYDIITVDYTKGETTNNLLTLSGTQQYSGDKYAIDLDIGDYVDFKYSKDATNIADNELRTYLLFYCSKGIINSTGNTIIGYENKVVGKETKNIYINMNGSVKKVIAGYIGTNGAAKLFFGSDAGEIVNNDFIYTGTYTTQNVTVSNQDYTLYTLTTSGTLTLKVSAQAWACGGGGGGQNAAKTGSGGGGGGGYAAENISLNTGTYPVIIGAGGSGNSSGSATSINGVTANGGNRASSQSYGGNGGSGGGSGGRTTISGYLVANAGTGSSLNMYPFGISTLKYHCAGGGAGGDTYKVISNNTVTSTYPITGGNGGSNGAAGAKGTVGTSGEGVGGAYGGGNGGANPGQGTYYGAGGGGGSALRCSDSSGNILNSGAAGYQGVVYILIPKA